MFKLTLTGILLFLFSFRIAAQGVAAESPKALLLNIQKSKPDTNRISLQLKLGSYYLFKEGEFKNDLDSAYNFFNQAAQLSDKLHEVNWQYKTLALIGNYYAEAGDLNLCKQCFMRVIAYYHQTGNKYSEANSWYLLGDLYNNDRANGHREERISYYQHARSLYLQNHQPLNANAALKNIADVQIINKQYDLAENNLQQVLVRYKALGYKKLQYTYDLLYSLESKRGNYYRALAYCSEGIKAMKASGDTELAGYFYFDMARGNYIVKQYKDALEWIAKARIADKGDVLGSSYLLVETLLALNRTEQARIEIDNFERHKSHFTYGDTIHHYWTLARYYNKINNNDLALLYYTKIMKLDHKDRLRAELYNAWSVNCNNEIADIYLKTNQAEKAKIYLNSMALIVKNAKTFIDPTHVVAFYLHLYQYDLATGNYQAAVKNLEQHDRIKDSLFTADKDKQVAELNIQYQSAEKEQDIKFLHSQSVVQQTRVEKANMQRNITIGGIILVSLFAGLFYRQYKQKQNANLAITQKNELITQKNAMLEHLLTEKEWLLKEVHHRVKNNLHTVISLLESQAMYLENDALKAIENSQHRIYAMSLIHQKLYQSEDVKSIDMKLYLHEFVRYLADSFGSADLIHFQLDIEPLTLGVSQAIPLGLIINEAVTNSIKYAFPENQMGVIAIRLSQTGDKIKLVVADNGIGIPHGISENEVNSLGIDLMKGLSRDLKGEIQFKVKNGTTITVVFGIDPFESESHLSDLTERNQYP